jgi:hypothetical protein
LAFAFSYAFAVGGRTGIWLRGVCASVTIVEGRNRTQESTFGRDCRFHGEVAGVLTNYTTVPKDIEFRASNWGILSKLWDTMGDNYWCRGPLAMFV